MSETTVTDHSTRALAAFVSELRYEDLPQEVVQRTEDFFLDWLASALAGRGAVPVRALEKFAANMGPGDGPSEVLTDRRRTSPLFAAMVNGAASHVVEQDDVHNGAVFHPAAVVFPATLATAQANTQANAGASAAAGRDFITAAVAGYEVGIRVGEYLGRSHYEVFHTTGTAGTLAAAAATARLLGLDEERTLDALGSAGTQAAGLWEFLGDGADSKQLHTAKAASDGLLAAYLARDGFTGARRVLEGERGLAAGTSTDADPERLADGLGSRWGVLETSFKFHASCRHSHPAADALLRAMREHGLSVVEIRGVRARVHRGAIDVLGAVSRPRTVHQSKFSMGFVLALIALRGRAGVEDFSEAALEDRALLEFSDRVEMVFDAEVDSEYPARWIGLVDVTTSDGRTFTAREEVPRGDPGNPLSRAEIEEKVRRLAAHSGAASPEEVAALAKRVWSLEAGDDLTNLLPPPPDIEPGALRRA